MTDPHPSPAHVFTTQVERFYTSLMAHASAVSLEASGSSLGGQFLYADELDADGRALVAAANIAGAASLAVTADAAAQKQAMRDGVVDFLVTSLDEALRILKNEIRKRETVAVCVTAAPEAVQFEMLERGVLPDLLRPIDGLTTPSPFVEQGARQIAPATSDMGLVQLTWSVASGPARWLPKLDAIALDSIGSDSSPSAQAARRWLRLAPRYLGRLANTMHRLSCDQSLASHFIERARDQVERSEIAVPVEIHVAGQGIDDRYRFSPPGSASFIV